MKKNTIIFLLLAILFIPYKVKAYNLTPSVDTSEKIYDYANLLTEEEKEKLHTSVISFIEEYDMDLVLVTISKNPYGVSDYYTEEYSQDFYDYNNFGIGTTKDGLIVLIDMDNRYPYITTTGQAILVYDDERIQKIHDNAYYYLKNGNYYQALETYVDSIDDYASDGIPESNKNYCINSNGEYYKCREEPKSASPILSLVVAIVGSLIPLKIHLGKYRGIKIATDANTYMKDVNMTSNIDQFLTTFTSRVRRYHDTGGGGSSHGGGSSISHGSSGSSHGGGGGHHF